MAKLALSGKKIRLDMDDYFVSYYKGKQEYLFFNIWTWIYEKPRKTFGTIDLIQKYLQFIINYWTSITMSMT